MHRQRIAIIGAGTAGLAAATLLGRSHEVTLIERATALAPVGAGILLQPSGLAALAELGCLEHLLRFGQRIDWLHGVSSGRTIMQVRYSDLGDGSTAHGLGVHRAALCHVLDTAVSAVAHRRWLGTEVQAIDAAATGASVRFTRDGDTHTENFDAVLVANGAASTLQPRRLLRLNRRYPWGAMWCIGTFTDGASGFDRRCLHQRYQGARFMMGVLPSGCLPQDPQRQVFSFFWSLPVRDMDPWRSAALDMHDWRRQATRIWPDVAPLIEPLTSASMLVPAIYRHVILSRWGSGRIGVLGDAAHATSPQLGQGANMALLDALALSRALDASDSWEGVWERYHASRSGSIRFYQHMSRLLTPMYQSGIPGAALVRDLLMSSCRPIPWLRRQMAHTVAGGKQGWL